MDTGRTIIATGSETPKTLEALYSEEPQSELLMRINSGIVHSDPAILGGEPVFVGTRVPVTSLFEWLEGGETLDEWLDNFPGVTREQAVSVLEDAKALTVAGARSTR
jgi:uncharacterized protein (DUF433 family)